MIDINPNVSVITLIVNYLNTPLKERNLHSRPKKIQPYAVYDKPNLNLKT